ncbi:bilirubin oxidase [Methyloglobulus morosus KoM1]|uniref:Bilirubin oxidase n=1 Tax=Methyloglobulus morosus KoM1 TaxID=1116472 RepID=V5BU46_9GAMM|nr:multicopper oxidase domain-containing protein [Methyloglobulus morosus]ESS71399.1 bilirubin oxidase [Methyloglobulus morosus KoM1]
MYIMNHFSATDSAKIKRRDKTSKLRTLSYNPLKLSSLTIAIAALSGFFVSSSPVQAKFNIPTDSTASPLCISGQPRCAAPFTAKMLMFEEFGTQAMPNESNVATLTSGMPGVADCQSTPVGTALDTFLNEPIHPFPTRKANDILPNAWADKIKKDCGLLPTNLSGVLEGRPGGEQFAHQRWDEFMPQAYFQSAMTGARINGGLRDKYQRHGYSIGEFGPGGLYHLDNNSTKGTEVKIHPNLPAQDPHSVWTFDGTLPPKLLMARYGEAVLFRHYNALPIDVSANNGFGTHTISTHEHNGHDGAENDGYAHAYFYPGQFYDYHWPMILAGHDSINKGATDLRTGAPDGYGGITPVPGDWRETMSTHWFHDHMLDFTAQNVYKGNAAMMNYYSAVDRGREPKDMNEASGNSSVGYGCHYANPNNANLCFPSGSGMDWGNRDYDVNLLVADKAWDNSGQLKFNIFNTDGFLGDRITVNWEYKPYLDVRTRRYRFRILNGSVSRYYKIAIVDESGNKIPYHMIANDGNIMQYAVPFPNAASAEGALPEQGIAERYDIVVDFKNFTGKKLYFVNLLEHENGLGPKRVVPLVDVLSGKYKADGINGDPVVGKFLEFRVKGCGSKGTDACTDLSMNPADYVEGNKGDKQMIPVNRPTTQELQAAVNRTFEFGRSNGTDAKPWAIKTDGGIGLNMDPHRLSAAPTLPDAPDGLGKVEIWHIKLGGGGWSHPVHVHFEEGQILYRGGKTPTPWEKYARKDVYRIGPLADSTSSVDMAIRFREFAGTYMEHCHNTQHEDKTMLLRWDIQHPGETIAVPTPMPEWDGVTYDVSTTLPTYKIGDLKAKAAFVLPK